LSGFCDVGGSSPSVESRDSTVEATLVSTSDVHLAVQLHFVVSRVERVHHQRYQSRHVLISAVPPVPLSAETLLVFSRGVVISLLVVETPNQKPKLKPVGCSRSRSDLFVWNSTLPFEKERTTYTYKSLYEVRQVKIKGKRESV